MESNAKEIDFAPYFSPVKAERYASEVLEDIIQDYDLELVMGDTYVKRPGRLAKYLPGSTEFAIAAEGSRLRYNPEVVNTEDVELAIDVRLEEARQEFASWKAIDESLEL